MDNALTDTGRFRAFWADLPPLDQSEMMARAGSANPEDAYAHYRSVQLGVPVLRPLGFGEVYCMSCYKLMGFWQERCSGCGAQNPNMELHSHG